MAKKQKRTSDYPVGFKKPPKDKQFKPGQSGNPKGRPRGSRNFANVVRQATTAPVRVRRDGKSRTVPTQEAALMRLVEKALAGDHRALSELLKLAATYNVDDEAGADAHPVKATHREIIDRFIARHAGKTEADEGTGDASGANAPDADPDNDDPEPEEDDDDDWLN